LISTSGDNHLNTRVQLGAEASPPRILVVEDEVLIRTLVAELLREAGASVIEATTADEAWSFFIAGGKTDLIISDLHTPGSLSGVQLAERIRSQEPALPIILTSGNPGPDNVTALGAFIKKPFEFNELVGLAGKLLNFPLATPDP